MRSTRLPWHGACGRRHEYGAPCPISAGGISCRLCDPRRPFKTKTAYERHLRNWHGILASDLRVSYKAPKEDF